MDHHQVGLRARDPWWLQEIEPGRRPVIVTNPSNDRQFRALIESALLSGAIRPADLERMLRTRYPLAVVRPRELAGERTAIWYVYREGHWIRSQTDET
jgi:hypothetical protein